jgi:hypothetical protein
MSSGAAGWDAPRASFASDGFTVVPRVIDGAECDELARRTDALPLAAGSRNLLEFDWCARLARHLATTSALAPFIRHDLVPVQCTVFTKTPGRNWGVAIHQDLSIPVARRVPAARLTGWSDKEGTPFVHAPAAVLDDLVAVRVHLDPCGPDDGPLRCVPGSHAAGRLSNLEGLALRDERGTVTCLAERGDAFVMRPLVLHASRRASGTSRRRVLHFLFGPRTLPLGLEWPTASELQRVMSADTAVGD